MVKHKKDSALKNKHMAIQEEACAHADVEKATIIAGIMHDRLAEIEENMPVI